MRVRVISYFSQISTFILGFLIGFLLHAFFRHIFITHGRNRVYFHQKIISGNESWKDDISTEKQGQLFQHLGKEAGKHPQILCYLLIGPSTHERAVHIKETWGRRCDSLLFFSTKKDSRLNPILLDVQEGYTFLWQKSKAALLYLAENHLEFDWFLKADDDTFVIMENLQYFLSDLSPDEAVYYGVKFKKFVKQGFMSGGGGYVLSREALKSFVTVAMNITDKEKCDNQANTGAEDLHLGKCMEASGVKAGDSLDSSGLPRFFSHAPTALYFKAPLINRFHWYWHYLWHQHSLGLNCCSRHVITFHDVDPRMMLTLEALLYRLHVHREYSTEEPQDLKTKS